MLSDLLALLNGSNSRALLLIFMPATITGMFLLPNASLLFMEDSSTFDTSISDDEVKLSGTDSSTSDGTDCSECHSDVEAQIHNSPVHSTLTCTDCHNQSQSTECEVNRSKVECMWCHQGYRPAGGFGLTANPNDTGSQAAHMGFIYDAINDARMLGANEACIACHTHTPVKINWKHRASLDIEVVFAEDTSDKHFEIGSWNYTGTANTTVWQDKNNKTLNFSVNLAT